MSQVMDKVDYPDEKIFQTMVEQSHDAVIIHTGFLIVYAAGRSLNQFGYEDPSLLVSRNILDLIFPGFHERIIGILAESDKNHSRTDFIEAEFLSPDKRRIPVEIASMPVCFRGCKSCLMFVRDIIRRKNIEDSLDASRQQLSGLFMLSHEAITVSRLEDGLVMDVNRAFLKIMNYSREEIIGKTGNDIDMWVYPEEREYAYKEIIEKGYCHSVENHYRTKDGRNLVGLVSAGLIDVRGEKCILAVTRDITERKKIEETLHETEDKFSRIFRLSPDVITITRLSDGLYIDVNDTFIKLMGYKRDEAIGRSSIELGIWSNLNDRFRIIRKIVKRGEVRNETVNFSSRKGNIIIGDLAGRMIDIGGETCLLIVVRDITKRKKAEKRISESEEKFSRVFKLSPDAITITRIRDAVYLDINEAFTMLMGYTRDEIIGKSAIEMNIWMSMEDRARVINEITTNGILTNQEIPFRRKNGTTLVGNLSGRTIEMHGELCILFITRDETDRKQIEEAVRINQERLKKAQEVGKVGSWEYNYETGMLWASEQFLAMFGLDPLENNISSSRLEDCFVEKGRFPGIMEDLARGNISFEIECPIVPHGKNDESIITFISELVRDDNGKPVKIIGVIRDITEQRRAEHALRESEERWQYALEGSGDGVWDWEIPQDRIYYSHRWKEMLGYGDNEIGDCPDEWFAKIHPDDADSHRQWRRILLEGIQTQLSCEYRMICRDESYKWILARGKVMSRNRDGSPERIVGTNTDISKRKIGEEERIRLKEKLHQIEKYDTLGRLAGGIAHDFNNMLVPIIGYAELMLSAPGCEGQLHKRLQGILQAAEGAKGLTQQILAFSRKQILQLKVLDINAEIESIQKMIRRLIGEDITVSMSLAEDLVHVEADSSQIQQIIMNLVLNARDAMPGGGKLIIETFNVYVDNLFAKRNPDMGEGEYVLLKVTDTGTGIPTEIRDRIFEPFFTTKEEGKGTGLGLATVYGIVKQHGGAIRVISEPGVGSCFLLYFPSVPCVCTDMEEGNLPAGNCIGTESILVVEDSDTVRDLTRQMLEYFGYVIYPATGWEEALNIIGDKEKIIDLVIMDVVMPGLNGFDLYGRISAIRPGIRVIFMSGYPENVVESNNVDKDNINFIRKPFSMRALAETVRRVLDVK